MWREGKAGASHTMDELFLSRYQLSMLALRVIESKANITNRNASSGAPVTSWGRGRCFAASPPGCGFVAAVY